MTVPPAPVRVPSDEGAVRSFIASNGVPYLQMTSVGFHVTSVRGEKTNDKDNNEMIPETVHIFSGIYPMAEENPGKLQLGDHW